MSKTSKKKPIQSTVNRAQKSSEYWHIGLIIFLSFITYSNALRGSFVWDDEIQIVKNWQIRDLSHVGSAFSSAFWAFADPEAARTNFYRPVQTLSYMLAYQISGLSAWSYHLVNVLFHTFASVLIYFLCVEYGISAGAALLAAAIFSVHPIHSEAVSWNAGTPDVTCGAFYFGSILLFLKYLKSSRGRWLWSAAVSFLAACFSKEMAVTLPAVAALIMLAKGRPQQNVFTRLVESLWPFGAAGVVYVGARLAALGFLSTTHLQIRAGVLDWFTLAVQVLGQYIHYSLLPYPLTAYHLIPLHLSDRVPSTLLYTAVVTAAGIGSYMLNRRVRGVAMWGLIFAITLIPVFNFTGISLTFFAERYLYIPTMASAMMLGLLLDKSRSIAKNVTVIIVLVFAVLTFGRNKDWQSDEKLYQSILRVHPEVAHVRNNLADLYMKRGDDVTARNYLESALHYLDSGVYLQAENEKYRAQVGLGAIAARSEKYAEAKDHLEKALEINPRGDWAYLYLGGVIMESEGDYPKAMTNFQKAIELGPLNEVARDYMGVALFNLKKYPEAIRYFQEALKINPTYKDAETHLGMAARALAS